MSYRDRSAGAIKSGRWADFGDWQADRSNDLVIAEVDKPDPAGIKSILEHMLLMHPGLGVHPLKVIGEIGLDARALGVDVDRFVDVLQPDVHSDIEFADWAGPNPLHRTVVLGPAEAKFVA